MAENKTPSKGSEALRRYHASRTPDQRAAWRRKVSAATSAAMVAWNANRDPAEREQARQRQLDAAVTRMWQPHKPGTRFPKGHISVASNDSLQRREFAKVRAASIKRILKEVVEEDPELIRRAIREGIQAPPPRSYPYLLIAAAYLDGKPVDANDELHVAPSTDLSGLSRDELVTRALSIAKALQTGTSAAPLPVIDVTPEDKR